MVYRKFSRRHLLLVFPFYGISAKYLQTAAIVFLGNPNFSDCFD